MCVGENATNKDHHQLVCNKLCFVTNMLYNKTNNYPAQSRRISPDFHQLSLWPHCPSIRQYSIHFCWIMVKYCNFPVPTMLLPKTAVKLWLKNF